MSLTLNDTHRLLALVDQLEAIPEAKEVKEELEEFLAEEGFDESGFDPRNLRKETK